MPKTSAGYVALSDTWKTRKVFSSKETKLNTRGISKIISPSEKRKAGSHDSGNCLDDKENLIESFGSSSSFGDVFNEKAIAELEKIEQDYARAKSALEKSSEVNRKSEDVEAVVFEKPPEESIHKKIDLSEWGLPEEILRQYDRKGIKQLFEWQAECLGVGSVLRGGSLVYSAPTSSGKTMVAELLMLKRVLELKQKAIMILPFVSVAREKMLYLQDMFQDAGVRVDGYLGNHNPAGGFRRLDIAVCTIEKGNSLVNRLLEEGRLGTLGTVVVDELHMLGDVHRGYLLELLLTKLLYASKRMGHTIQIIGMSATLPNLDTLASWLAADLYRTDFRPVPLHEYVKIGADIYNVQSMALVRKLSDDCCFASTKDDPDNVVTLCLEMVASGHSVLVFCPTKQWCESLAQVVAKYAARIVAGESDENELRSKLRTFCKTPEIADVLERLRRCPAGLDSVLVGTVDHAVAFHHAGLSFDERDIIEGAFRQGALKVLVATTTLSSGVNLPARRVIVRSPMSMGKVLDVLTYKQMVGRAGRQGVDTEGESILLCKESERRQATCLVSGELKPVRSCLVKDGHNLALSLKRAILEIISSDMASSAEEISLYMSCTLLAASMPDKEIIKAAISTCIEYLLREEFIYLHKDRGGGGCEKYLPSKLGKAVLASSLNPDEALVVFAELSKALKNFVLENEMHLIYQITPPYVSDQLGSLDWLNFLNLWSELPEDVKRVGELVGVEERFMARSIRGNTSGPKQAIHRRFYAALALNDLVREVRLSEVARKFACNRGILQSLQQNASTFAGMVTAFCNKLGWHNMEQLVSQFQHRLHFGIQPELCDLVRLSSLNGRRARSLYDGGFESVMAVATATPSEIETLLINSVPFKRHNSDVKAIWIDGKVGLNEKEAAQFIVHEARSLIQKEFGPVAINWQSSAPGFQSQVRNISNDGEAKESENTSVPNLGNGGPNLVLDKELSKLPSVDCAISKRESLQDESGEKECAYSLRTRLRCHSKRSSPEASSRILANVKDESRAVSVKKTKISLAKEVEVGLQQTFSVKKRQNSNCGTLPSGNVRRRKTAIGKKITRNEEANVFAASQDLFSNEESANANHQQIVKSPTPLSDSILLEFDSSKWDISVEAATAKSPLERFNVIPPTPPKSISKSQRSLHLERTCSPIALSLSPTPVKANKLVTPSLIGIKTRSQRKMLSADLNANKILISSTPKSSPVGRMPDLSVTNDGSFAIVDVCADAKLFEVFVNEWKEVNVFSISVCCRNIPSTDVVGIGAKFTSVTKNTENKDYEDRFRVGNDLYVIGIAVSWQDRDAYYISLREYSTEDDDCGSANDDSLNIGKNDPQLTTDRILQATRNVLCRKGRRVIVHNAKLQLRLLASALGFPLTEQKWMDPQMANWILDPGSKPRTLQGLVINCIPDYRDILDIMDEYTQRRSRCPERLQSLTEAVLAFHLMKHFQDKLRDFGIEQFYLETEMRMVPIVASMEELGIGFDVDRCEKLTKQLRESLAQLQKEAHRLAMRPFNLLSSTEVCKVLYRELRLGSGADWKKDSSKSSLERLKREHRLPGIILEWRKVSMAITKTVMPLLKAKSFSPDTKMHRVCASYDMQTATGRIVTSWPNLQGVHREFDLASSAESLNLRNCFVSAKGRFLLAADYSQLELRVLAHLSGDVQLLETLNGGNDVFVAVAAAVNCVSSCEVTDAQRQQAKQLCYGMIYGMGIAALCQQLDVDEGQATAFVESFKSAYPGVRDYVASVIGECARTGFVGTLSGRRRYLTSITSKNASNRSAAERQAVNTTVQGSAADLVKMATVTIDDDLRKTFAGSKGKSVARLVLQLHDELIYEVDEADLSSVARIVRRGMEGVAPRGLLLPVKLRVGTSWGSLAPFLKF